VIINDFIDLIKGLNVLIFKLYFELIFYFHFYKNYLENYKDFNKFNKIWYFYTIPGDLKPPL
jgi:hypothetical protein